ncbi:MAG: polysaccharide biosynthesis/export family protein, partial [Candidatus Marinimicrobia bacterium]|nr:polysaccharide biosynthesis/export family protein [Candidatus Neomarinimicrobiota bacterium]
MRICKLIFFLSISMSLLQAQEFGRLETPGKEVAQEEQEESTLPVEVMKLQPLDQVVDPNKYILGPGDEIGISIQIDKVKTFPLVVTPTGDLFIPSVGVCQVAGLSLSAAIDKVKTFIRTNAFPQAKTHMVLLNPRIFNLQVTGAVQKPGFIKVSSVSRLAEVIELAEGFNPLAKEFAIEVKHPDGSIDQIDFIDFLLSGNLENNPTFMEGDQVMVPFGDVAEAGIMLNGPVEDPGVDIITANETLSDYIKRRVIFLPGAEVDNVIITRGKGNSQEVVIIESAKIKSTILKPGDRLDFGWERGISVTGFVQEAGSF